MKLELRRVTVATPGAANARHDWPERQSLLLRLSDRRGNAGVGEASPLPGYSRGDWAEAEAALARLEPGALERALDHDSALDALAAAARLLPESAPAARSALETAALDLLGQQRRTPAPELLGAARGSTRPLCALLGKAADAELVERAAGAVQAGYACLKLKVGVAGALERELEQLGELRRRLGPRVALRLDANGSLSAAELERSWPVLELVGIELFEEPGPAPGPGSRVPLGVDESLQGLDEAAAEAHLRARGASFAVLKPTALGGVSHCWRVAQRAKRAHAAVIVSHCFDGPWAFRAAAALALALAPGPAHGLAPYAALAGWPGSSPPCARDGALEAWTESGLGIAGGFD